MAEFTRQTRGITLIFDDVAKMLVGLEASVRTKSVTIQLMNDDGTTVKREWRLTAGQALPLTRLAGANRKAYTVETLTRQHEDGTNKTVLLFPHRILG